MFYTSQHFSSFLSIVVPMNDVIIMPLMHYLSLPGPSSVPETQLVAAVGAATEKPRDDEFSPTGPSSVPETQVVAAVGPLQRSLVMMSSLLQVHPVCLRHS